jgi:hypothetical protein
VVVSNWLSMSMPSTGSAGSRQRGAEQRQEQERREHARQVRELVGLREVRQHGRRLREYGCSADPKLPPR